jgi:MurNAc alpha-1-phosphate uridylyltransferase
MLLAAGRGERMRPLTDHLPKPLLPAGGKPLIVWHLLRLAKAGIRDIVINHAWLGEKIAAALGDGAAFGVRISYSVEDQALETAGGIARALPLLTLPAAQTTAGAVAGHLPGAQEEPFLVISADTFCDFDYGRAHTIALQMKHAGLACWCVMVPNPPHHGDGDFDLVGGVLRVATVRAATAGNEPSSRLTYAGIGLYSPRMFAKIAPGAKSPLRPWLEQEIAGGRAGGEFHGGRWLDIGTPQRLGELDQALAGNPTAPSINTGA